MRTLLDRAILTAGGERLPASLRPTLESFFAADLRDVRVHVGRHVAALGADAFAAGAHIHFAPGLYQPGTLCGQELIVHELAHVLQQRAGRVPIPPSGAVIVEDAALEAEAVAAGRAWRHGLSAPSHLRTGPTTLSTRHVPIPGAAVAIQRAIHIGQESVTAEAAADMLGHDFDHVKPAGLIGQILTRFDFQNRRFANVVILKQEVQKAVIGEAMEGSTPPNALWNRGPDSRFKNIRLAKVQGVQLVELVSKDASAAVMMKVEQAALDTLKLAGLRVVPVYGCLEATGGQFVLFENWLQGNFLDSKDPYNQKQMVSLMAALYGIQMVNTENCPWEKIQKQVEVKSQKEKPPLSAIEQALRDFERIRDYQATHFIVDLQGILELNTGKFFIIDPAGVIANGEVEKKGETPRKLAREFVEAILGHLRFIQKHFHGTPRPVVIPKLPPPPKNPRSRIQ